MKFKDIVRELETLGYSLARIKGSHHIFQHPMCIKPYIIMHNTKSKDLGHSETQRYIREANRNILAFPKAQ